MFKRLLIILAAMASITTAHAAEVTGAGATFPYPLYAKWSDQYLKETKVKINYQSIGSGAGIKQIQSRTVTFGATDMPLRPDVLEKSGLVQWPQVIGAVVVVINVDGIQTNQLTLDGATLADIYLGKIRTWNHAAIQKLNPSIKLPSANITVVRRSDGSGTTFNFTNYLSKVSDEWRSKVGEGTAIEWPVGVGARGNEGVAGNVSQTRNSIGYVEYAYAKQNRLTYTRLINRDGQVVTASVSSFSAAASGANWSSVPGFGVILTDQPGANSWPIAAATFILMYRTPASKDNSQIALNFFNWAFNNGKSAAEELDFVPMPDDVIAKIRSEIWSQIQH